MVIPALASAIFLLASLAVGFETARTKISTCQFASNQRSTTRQTSFGINSQRKPAFSLCMTEDDLVENKKKKRRRRKESLEIAELDEEDEFEFRQEPETATLTSPTAVAPLVPRSEFEVVEVPIKDVRNMGGQQNSLTTIKSTINENSDIKETDFSKTAPSMKSGDKSSLDSLLADARRLRAAKATPGKENDEAGVGDAVKNVISTIVTVDFFVVCGLLLWFIAGIFCSYVLKDDTVQISFNNIFEPVVQPALGVLMIAAVAGAVFNQKKDDDA